MLSVIVPVYNVKDYIVKCVDSIKHQTYSDIEIILVDDGSTDGCAEICDAIKESDLRIKVIHKKNDGLMSAWITGVKEARGAFIGFVDSDDFCDNDYFEVLMKPILCENVDIAIGGYCIDYSVKKINKPISSDCLKYGIYEGERLEIIKKEFFKEKGTLYWARWLRVCKKEIILSNLSLLDTMIRKGEDIGIALATLFDANKIALVNTVGYHYVQRETSIMNTMSKDEINNFDKLCTNINYICDIKGYTRYLSREYTTQMLVLLQKICRANMGRINKKFLLKNLRDNKWVKKIYETKDYGKRSIAGNICVVLFRCKLYALLLFLLKAH